MDEFSAIVGQVVELNRGMGGAARHKPLLLGLALSDGRRWWRFVDIEKPLGDLIARFGRTSNVEPLLPFWHLQNDRVWIVRRTNPDDLVYRADKQRPTLSSLRKSGAVGGFDDRVWRLVGTDDAARTRLLHVVIDEYFDLDERPALLEALAS